MFSLVLIPKTVFESFGIIRTRRCSCVGLVDRTEDSWHLIYAKIVSKIILLQLRPIKYVAKLNEKKKNPEKLFLKYGVF